MRTQRTTTADRPAKTAWQLKVARLFAFAFATLAIAAFHDANFAANAANIFNLNSIWSYQHAKISIDFGDVHQFSVPFERLQIQNPLVYESADVCNVVWLTGEDGEVNRENRAFMMEQAEEEKPQDIEVTSIKGGIAPPADETDADGDNAVPLPAVFTSSNQHRDGVGIAYGFRALNSTDPFDWQAYGGIIGSAFSNTNADNQILAPQFGLIWARSQGNWSIQTQGNALVGYNVGRLEQHNGIGYATIPGALNRPLFAQPSYNDHVESHRDLSPGGEIRVESSFHFTNSISLRFAWSELFIDNILLSDNRVAYVLPDMGFRDPGDQKLLIQNLYCGIEYVR